MTNQYVYVASSWRNPMHVAVTAALQSAGLDHYDFRHPEPGSNGFRWSDTIPDWREGEADGTCSFKGYMEGLAHPVARHGFATDFAALNRATHVICVLPCNRSAHLELGYAVGQGKQTAILLDDEQNVRPELMYLMAHYLTPSLFDLLGWLGVRD